jgi:tRNA U38,U39,U40 pseudouridine synthase TruA
MDKFEDAANLLRGVHDFKSFSFQPAETEDTVRNLEIDVIPANETNFARERSSPIDIYHIHFKSRAFLHNQVSGSETRGIHSSDRFDKIRSRS